MEVKWWWFSSLLFLSLSPLKVPKIHCKKFLLS